MLLRAVILSTVVLAALILQDHTVQAQEQWWKHMQLYQIYPRSMQDTNNDGIGDLKGITQKLEHLKDLGITATWLSPIFPSPMKDFGYDISNFYDVAPEYGTMADLENLIAEAKRLGIRILLDFVPNHTSDQCDWFQLSVNKTPGYEDYYVWHPGKPGPNNTTLPPSNWISCFRRTAWTWHPVRKEYYLHQFMPEQPDLNYRSPRVVAQMKDVLTFWLNKGVDGFRVDAIPHLVETAVDASGNYPDEPISGNTDDAESYDYLTHIHTRERAETFEQVYGWRAVLDKFAADNKVDDRVLLMEAMSDTDIVMQYYGNSTHEGAHFPFNFIFAFGNQYSNAKSLANDINYWFSKVPKGRVSNWVLGNHDQPRLASRYGSERADGIVMLGMLLPGVSITYQGEEIGMEDFYLSYAETQDPQACNSGPELYNSTSRDPERTPFHWDATKNAGFSTSDKTWLPVADNYKTLNLAAQKTAARSVYKMYKSLSSLRQLDLVKNGEVSVTNINGGLAVLRYTTNPAEAIVVVINFEKVTVPLDLKTAFSQLGDELRVLVTSVKSSRSPGNILSSSNLLLVPDEALVLANHVTGV